MSSEGRRRSELGFPNGRFVDGLDDVARGLAAGTISRGKAIKLGGAALLGSMGLFSLFEGKAEAQGVCEGIPAINNTSCPPLQTMSGQCGACPSCFCTRTVSGSKRCLDFTLFDCPSRDQCDSNRDCRGDEVCARVGGCCGHPQRNACVPPCPTDPDACPMG